MFTKKYSLKFVSICTTFMTMFSCAENTEYSVKISLSEEGQQFQITPNVSKPESVYAYGDAIYVSNIDARSAGGSSTAKDGSGWILKTDKNGSNPSIIWQGLNAPKGMRALGDKLYFTDIDEVVIGNLTTRQIEVKIPISNARFLNDLVVSSNGDIYVSDTTGKTIYKITWAGGANYQVEKFMANMLEAPNGLLVVGDELVVCSWGQNISPNFAVTELGSIIAIDIATKQMRYISHAPLGNLDGIEKVGNYYIVSAKVQDSIFAVDATTGEASYLIQANRRNPNSNHAGFDPADIGFDEENQTLLIPNMGYNRISAVKLNF